MNAACGKCLPCGVRTVYIDTVDSSWFDVCQTMYPKNLAKGKSVTEDACIEEVRFQYSSNRIEILLHHKFAWKVPHNRDFPFVDYKMEVLAGVLCQMKAQGHMLQDDPKFSVFTHKDIWNDGRPIGKELSNMHKPEVHVLRIPLRCGKSGDGETSGDVTKIWDEHLENYNVFIYRN